jgi:hypothetical protein
MNYMIVQITPPALNNIGYKTYIIFAVLNACWVPIIYLFFPETKGLELEDVDRLFAKGGELERLRAAGDAGSAGSVGVSGEKVVVGGEGKGEV